MGNMDQLQLRVYVPEGNLGRAETIIRFANGLNFADIAALFALFDGGIFNIQIQPAAKAVRRPRRITLRNMMAVKAQAQASHDSRWIWRLREA